MTRSRKTITAIAGTVVLAAGATITMLAVSGSHAPTAHTAVHHSAACSKLAKSPNRPATYELLIISKMVHLYGMNPTGTQDRLTHEFVAADIRAHCPQFSYLAHA